MNSQNVQIFQSQELINAIEKQGGNTVELLRQQSATLMLLNGLSAVSLGINTGFFFGVLGELALQSGFINSQLN